MRLQYSMFRRRFQSILRMFLPIIMRRRFRMIFPTGLLLVILKLPSLLELLLVQEEHIAINMVNVVDRMFSVKHKSIYF